jgi:hypothetical protein
MLTLYHSQPTGNSYKVRLLPSILQIPYTAVAVDIFNGDNKSAVYRRINPLGKANRRCFALVEPRGVEPLTSSLRTRRSPN